MTVTQEPDDRFLRFVREHEDRDVTRLLLGRAPCGIDLRAAAEQILARRKARTKVPDWHAEGVLFPSPAAVEQASSQATATYKATLVAGAHLVDLTGGMGVDTLALAPRFDTVTYVEPDPQVAACFAHNARLVGRHAIEVVCASAEQFLATFQGPALFFIDPARRDGERKGAYRFAACSPDVVALLPRLRGTADQVLVKASPMHDVREAVRQLEAVAAVHVVGLGNDCRELLLHLNFASPAAEPVVVCADLASGQSPFRFRASEELAAAVSYSQPRRYLYDANATIRKAGAFRAIAAAYGLHKLAPNTHLYTADRVVPGFPGRIFEVVADAGRRPRRLLPDRRANVISRNHPLSAERIRQAHRLRDGGERFLVGYRDLDGRARLAVATRLAGQASARSGTGAR